MLAQQGKLEIVVVIVLAALAAIIGDNAGYAISRRFGRRLLTRPGRMQARRLAALERGEAFFERHGPKAVFFGRWITGLRVWASWLAGITGMPWRSFLFWNALGGVMWAVSVGLAGYLAGKAAEAVVAEVGIGAAIAAGVAIAVVVVVVHVRGRAHREDERTQP